MAAITLPRLEDDIEEPMCLDCADGLACSFKRCAGQGRQESSVAVTAAEVDRLGLIEEPSHIKPITHRTPEELGVPSIVPDVPERKTVLPHGDEGLPSRPARVKRNLKSTMRTIPLTVAAITEPEGTTMTVKSTHKGCARISDEIRKAILSASPSISNCALARRSRAMSHSALSAARDSVGRKLVPLTVMDFDLQLLLWRSGRDPDAALELAEFLDARIGSLITGVNLLRQEAKLAIEARKGCVAA
jgi:hypothetical protein